ncbi:hypothetical protein GCM10022423_30180 [Flavobacterium ginsengiterrae]|uniref:Lysozyme n=2 Tax=Flavobacterium ginsengiterrae TaxID=871695 RepID=A0ABP7GQY8_9FLAO
MNKKVIHNFNLLIKKTSSSQNSEDLTKTIIKELAQVSKEMNQHKDIVQIWQEQNAVNTVLNNPANLSEEGVFGIHAADKTALSINNTSSVSQTPLFTQISTASIGRGASDTTERIMMNSFTSAGNTLPVSEAENDIMNDSISQIYQSIDTKQTLNVPQDLQLNNDEPSVEVIKAEIEKKLAEAAKANDTETIQYWTRISNAFNEGATVADFNGKPGEMLFTEMYAALKRSRISSVEIQNFNWESVRQKMIKAIDANILKGSISKENKTRWETIKKQLADDKTNVANLFEQYDELFLLLKEVEGLETLPNTISITTKTKVYPNLSADKLYAAIGKEDIYVKQVSETKLTGSGVNKGAIKIKNANVTSFIAGESLQFFVDEAFINQKVNQKENINWIVYNTNTKKENIFKNEGTSFSYNFDTPGIYRIDAYGQSHTVKQKKGVKSATFIELKIDDQDIVITPPATIKGEFTRPFVEEKVFKVSLKNTTVKSLNPIKLYYQIETTISGKSALISEERELDSTGIIKLTMPDLGTYKIKVASKDQYGLTKEFKTSVIQNEVTSIGLAENSSESNIFLLGIPNSKLTLKTKTFKINPPTVDEKEDVRWMIYDANNKPYLASGFDLSENKKDPQRAYIHKWNSFIISIPQKAGNYTVEAFSDRQKGAKSQCIYKFEVKEPQIAEAYWAWSGGTKKTISGLLENNYINASIPHYNNQKVRIYFYLNDKKTNHFIDVVTNESGNIFKEISFDLNFQKLIGFQTRKNAKIGFKLIGIQNAKPYPFKSPANYDANTLISLTTEKKVLDVYFTYDGKRVKPEDEVPFGKKGAIVTLVAKTQNMVGEEIELKAHKVSQGPSFIGKAKVNSEGIGTTSFLLKNLDKKLKIGTTIKYYAGVEGYSTRHLDNKVLVMIVGEGKKKVGVLNNDAILQEARIKAFLRMIRVGEGTIKNDGYEKLFGGSSFIDDYKKTWEDHPGIVIQAKGKDSKGKEKIYYSSASGAYQIKKDIWNDWGKKFREFYDIKDFSPESQDKFALIILKHKRGKDVIRLIREDKIEDAVKLCQGEWASLPDSPHGQPTVTWDTVMTEYKKFLKEELEGKSPLSLKSGFLKDLGYGDDQKKEIINDVILKFVGSSANRADLSFKTINVLKEVSSASKNFEIKITSTKRSTYDQARIMYENCESTGGKYQKDQVYGDIGDKVVEVYIKEAEINKKEKEAVIKKMEEKIIALDPENVSKHLGNYIFLETFDIQYSGLPNPKDFKKEFLKRKELDHILYEPKNNCYHIQINQ